MERLKQAGMQVKMQVLDNEVSANYIKTITETWKSKYQLAPPDMHQRNAAEQAICTMKAHFLAIPPASIQVLLLPQAELTINLLQKLLYGLTKSAWEAYKGPYNFNVTPMAPPGCRVIAHAKKSHKKIMGISR
jgi:hypothetical protein